MKIMWSLGHLPKALSEVLATVHPAASDDANDFHRSLESAFRRAAFTVRREFPMPYADRAGRIDIHAHRTDTGNLWLELDRNRPRSKSIQKLKKAFNKFGGFAAIVCRCS